MRMIERDRHIERVTDAFRVHPAVVILGPRQCGKTTLARLISRGEGEVSFFDLESVVDRRKLSAPMRALERRRGLVVLDEIQRMPELYECLRVLLDRPDRDARFLLLGSASPRIVRGMSESLAGRIGFVDLSGFAFDETGAETMERLWERGAFPRSFLAPDMVASNNWREGFIRTFLERDIPQLGISIPAEALRRFWTMIAHYHGQVWNGAEFARSLGNNEGTARRYLDILSGAFVVRVLPPWFENLGKRQLKSPKVYIRDSGLLHSLLGLNDLEALSGHPKFGPSWEGFAIEQILSLANIRSAYYWATHGGAELDLMLTLNGRRYGFEFKTSDAPGSTRSMRIALRDLGLEHLYIIYPGRDAYAINGRISVIPLSHIEEVLASKMPNPTKSAPVPRFRSAIEDL